MCRIRLLCVVMLLLGLLVPARARAQEVLTDEDIAAAIQTLKDVVDPGLSGEKAFRFNLTQARKTLARGYPQTFPAVVALLDEPNAVIRLNAAIVLAEQAGEVEVAPPELIEALKRCVHETSPAVAYWGLQGLVEKSVPATEKAAAIAACLEMKRPQLLRLAAANAAEQNKVREALPWLVEHLKQTLPACRAEVEGLLSYEEVLNKDGRVIQIRNHPFRRSQQIRGGERDRMMPGGDIGPPPDMGDVRIMPGRDMGPGPGMREVRPMSGRDMGPRRGMTTGRYMPGPGGAMDDFGPGPGMGYERPSVRPGGRASRTPTRRAPAGASVRKRMINPSELEFGQVERLLFDLQESLAVMEVHQVGRIAETLAKKSMRDFPFGEEASFETNPPWAFPRCVEAAIVWLDENRAEFPGAPIPTALEEPVAPVETEEAIEAEEAGETEEVGEGEEAGEAEAGEEAVEEGEVEQPAAPEEEKTPEPEA